MGNLKVKTIKMNIKKLFLQPRVFSQYEMAILLVKIANKHKEISYQAVCNIAKWKVAELKKFIAAEEINFLAFHSDSNIQLWCDDEQEKLLAKLNIPINYRSDEHFMKAFLIFAESRKEKRKPITPNAAERFFKEWDNYPIDIITQCVQQSAVNGYTGVFPNKYVKPKESTHNAQFKTEF
jgi:hypothetical protein